MNSKVLVTGSTGFIGTALVRRLGEIGHSNIIQISRAAGVDFLEPDWVDILPQKGIDTVVHLAQSVRYREFPEGAEDMRIINIDTTARLLEWARHSGVKRFIFASTGNVYKNSNKAHIESEDIEPSGFYGTTKLCGEYLVNQYCSFFNVINIRMFGVYGPGQTKMLIQDMIKRVVQGESVELASGKGLVFNPIFIDDCINFIIHLLRINIIQPKLTVNVGGEQILDLGQIVDIIGEIMGIAAVKHITMRSPSYLIGDITKMKKIFQREPFVSIEDGLIKMLRG